MGIRDLRCFSQRGSVVQACVVERRMSNMSRHQLGQRSAHGPAFNTGMPSAIDLVRHDVHECKTLSLRELVPSCAPGSFSVILARFTCTASSFHAVGCTRLHWNMMRSMRQILPAQSENEGSLYIGLLVISIYFFRQV